MKKIAIVSGKGGVGKSSITASLAIALSKHKKIICADCDVDAPNLALVFGLRRFDKFKTITTSQKAKFDLKKCIACKKCYESCYFNAIEWKNNKPYLKDFSCEGCGVCKLVCPSNAIKLVNVKNAKIGYAKTGYGFKIVSGQLEIGESGSGKIVAEVKRLTIQKANNTDIMLVDAAAGIGCPVIASIVGSNYVIAITEPTPSGFSDLKRVLEVVNHFKISYSIIINRYDINLEYTEKIGQFAKRNNIKIIAKIPYDRSFVDALVNLKPVIIYNPKYEKIFYDIKNTILENIN